MAPEQADARPVGPRTDLYSLGGVLYTLLARRPPFRAKSLTEMLELQRSATPSRSAGTPETCPAELEGIIARLLEKDPERRFATATVLARRLEAMIRRLSSALGPETSQGPTAEQDDFALGPTGLPYRRAPG